ncbi:hypothetical protein [Deinococcus radiotolerans]|uniref:Uncharacterized protein n=1 Tax=Deinococcus radiotolerans TaxID=1309407 RepID=A0ABQ2FL87_9DEIO|nr:hypothetical protein [Deinococcus radiotolerans]GGL08694.1 hypothetical protein GCM10010844_29310 [Deinococcus radiotolerans]
MNKPFILLIGALLLGQGSAQTTKAGTVITNQAAATFQNAAGQTLPTAYSQVVSSTVLPMPGFDTVYRDGQDGATIGNTATGPVPSGYAAQLHPGDELLTAYTLVNMGNTDQTVALTSVTTGSPNSGQTVTYYLDSNGDGLLSAQERAAGPVTQVTLNWNDP